jgi:hypothetical protein
LFSVEQLARHAAVLATTHTVVTSHGTNQLIARLSHNEEVLRSFNRKSLDVGRDRRLTPAAEWLLDNFYLIEEQVHLARRHLPRGYSRELPRLLEGPSAGFPRVYDIVLELIAYVDAQIEAEPLTAFVAAYQSVTSLKLGELWAIPIMLRLGLIENLQRVTTRLVLARNDRDLASQWVTRLRSVAERTPSQLVVVVADMAKSGLPISSSFVAEFCQCLSRQSPVLHLARTWLEQWLMEQGRSIEQMVQLESQTQASDQVSVSHSIASLRFLSAMNWKDFVESLSAVESVLRSDPAKVYATMDFTTRDRYRHSVEFFARYGDLSESDVAARAVQLAARGDPSAGGDERRQHVGYYLIDKGQAELGRNVKVRWPWRALLEHGIHRFPLLFYAGGILSVTSLTTLLFISWAAARSVDGWRLVFLGIACLLRAHLRNRKAGS